MVVCFHNTLTTLRKLIASAFFVFLLTPYGASAQGKNKLERLVEGFYRIMEGDSAKPKTKYFFTLPIWAVTPETGLKVGVSLGYMFRTSYDSITRPSMVRLNTSYTQMRQFNIRPSADIFFKHNEYNFKAQYVYNDFNEYYWGIGNTAPDSAKELYDFQQHKLNVRLTKQIVRNLYLGPQILYEKLYDTRFVTNSPADASTVSGIHGYDLFGFGLALAFDNRDHIYFPKKGAYLEISNYYYINSRISDHNFHGITVDVRKFFTLWKDNVLAVQGFGTFNYKDVPYRQMGVMGNEMIMRGYYNGRYRDNHFVSVQTELRKTIWGPVGMVVFGGIGNVGKDGPDLLKNIKPNYGFGLRATAIRREHINARLDIGFGEKKIRGVYITLSEAF